MRAGLLGAGGAAYAAVTGPETAPAPRPCPRRRPSSASSSRSAPRCGRSRTPSLVDGGIELPGRHRRASGSTGALGDARADDAEALVDRLVRDGAMVRDPLVGAVLRGDRRPGGLRRTLERRFRAATGLTRGAVRQIERAPRGGDARCRERGDDVVASGLLRRTASRARVAPVRRADGAAASRGQRRCARARSPSAHDVVERAWPRRSRRSRSRVGAAPACRGPRAEQALARPQQHREHEQVVPVDQIGVRQAPGQLGAAVDEDGAAVLSLERRRRPRSSAGSWSGPSRSTRASSARRSRPRTSAGPCTRRDPPSRARSVANAS